MFTRVGCNRTPLTNACGGQTVYVEATPHEIGDDGLRARSDKRWLYSSVPSLDVCPSMRIVALRSA